MLNEERRTRIVDRLFQSEAETVPITVGSIVVDRRLTPLRVTDISDGVLELTHWEAVSDKKDRYRMLPEEVRLFQKALEVAGQMTGLPQVRRT